MCPLILNRHALGSESSMSFGHFQHKPLDLSRRQIRLVRLRRQDGSSQHNSRLRCEVQHFDMDDPDMPAYRALSYVWGNKSPHFYLRINDDGTSSAGIYTTSFASCKTASNEKTGSG